MKTSTFLPLLLVVLVAAFANGQTVSGRAPIVVSAGYTSASSPVAEPSQWTTTRYAPPTSAYTNQQPMVRVMPVATATLGAPRAVAVPISNQTTTAAYYAPASARSTPIVQTYAASPISPGAGYAPANCSGTATTVRYAPVTYPSPPTRTFTYRPLIPIQSLPNSSYIGQGIYGQPKAYVDGQPVRNFFRYILP